MNKTKRILFIFGMGEFADILFEKLKYDNVEIEGFTVDREYARCNEYAGKKVIPFEDIDSLYPSGQIGFYLGVIGKHNMFAYRKQVFDRICSCGYIPCNYISPQAGVYTDEIGLGNVIMENVVIEKHCKIGDGNIIWPNVVLPHHNKVGSFNNLSPSASFSGYAEVGNQCFIGNNAVLNNHAIVHDCALVGAGAFVQHELVEEAVLVANRSYVLEGRKSYEFK